MKIRGKLISIEGIDGCGKDTQIKNVYNYLRDNEIQTTIYTFPDYNSPIGQSIKYALSNVGFSPYALQLLFSADRAQQFQSIAHDIHHNKTVLTSRSKWSSYIYAIARGLPYEWAKCIESFIPEPDLVFYLDIDVKTSISRTGGSDLLEKDKLLLERCRKEYLSLAKTYDCWHIIDAKLSIYEVFNKIIDYLEV